MAEPSPQQRTPANTAVSKLQVSIVDDRLEVTAVLTDSDEVDRLISILTNNKHFVPFRNSHED